MFTLEPPLESIILAISTLSAHTTAPVPAIGSRLVAQPSHRHWQTQFQLETEPISSAAASIAHGWVLLSLGVCERESVYSQRTPLEASVYRVKRQSTLIVYLC